MKRSYDTIRKNIILLFCLAALSVVGFPVCIYHALSRSTVVNTALINSMTPVFIVVISIAAFGGTFRLRQVVGIVISMTGMLFIISKGHPSILVDVRFGQGDLWVLAAATSWALYSNLLRRHAIDLHPLGLLAILIFCGLLLTIPLYVWELSTGQTMKLN